MLYITLAILLVLFSLCSISQETKLRQVQVLNEGVFFILVPVILILLGGLRWLTGTDWNNYHNFYKYHDTWKSFNNGEFELLFTFLNFICRQISSEYTFFLLIFTSLVISFKFYTWKKIHVRYFGLVVFLWYCYSMGDISAVRQDLSIAILLFSIPSIIRKDKRKFIIITLIAVFIHNSSIIWFLAYYIYWRKRKNRNIDIFILFTFSIIGFFGSSIYIKLLDLIINILPASGRIYGKIVAYSIAKQTPNYFGISLNLLKRLMVFPFFFIYEKKIAKKCEWFSGLFSLYIFGTCIYFMFLTSFQVFQRFTNVFLIMECILLPEVYGVMNKQNKSWFILFLYAYGFMKLTKSISAFWYVKMPYYSIFFYNDRSMDWNQYLDTAPIQWSW